VIERKLVNLALLDWPGRKDVVHRLGVVDDARHIPQRNGVHQFAGRQRIHQRHGRLAANAGHVLQPGKPGAVQTALRELGRDVDLILLTDADVLLAQSALTRAIRRFDDPELALLTGAQRFVLRLPESGDPGGLDVNRLGSAAEPYDRLSSAVRAFESRSGRCFSVHGQFLMWRSELGLAPTLGIAADDLDLMLQLRHERAPQPGQPWRVVRAGDVHFFEEKTAEAGSAQSQALRRARAYFQVLRRSEPPRRDVLGSAQWYAYRYGPLIAPYAAPLVLVALLIGAGEVAGSVGQVLFVIALIAGLVSPFGRRFVQLLRIMSQAARLDRREEMPEQWEMARR